MNPMNNPAIYDIDLPEADDYLYGSDLETANEEIQNMLDDIAYDYEEQEAIASDENERDIIRSNAEYMMTQLVAAQEELQGKAEQLDEIVQYYADSQLVSEGAFVDYAQGLAEDVGALNTAEWPARHIDWEAAAHDLKHDYDCIDYRGVTYYVV